MTARNLVLGFAGTPDIAAGILDHLIRQTTHTIKCVLTQPDKPVGRGRKSLNVGPVKNLALEHSIALLQPESSKDIDNEFLSGLDVLVVVAFGQILPERILQLPRLGCINVHTSLLPRWRGAAPIQRAIEAGDFETGVSIMKMTAGLDTGPIFLQQRCPIQSTDTSGSLYEKLAYLGAEALTETLDQIEYLVPNEQDEQLATYAKKLTKAEAFLDWEESAEQLERKIRAFNPAPVACFEMHDLVLRVREAKIIMQQAGNKPGMIEHCAEDYIDIATGNGLIRINKIQPPGKKEMTIKEFLNGHPDFFVQDHKS